MVDNENSIRCRYCGQRNQIRLDSGDARCGRCRLPLSDAPHKKFAHLDKDQYIHPADRRALAALRQIPGIDTALKKLLAVTGESAIRVIFTASAVKVTPTQCPDLYAKLQIACTTLGVDMPEFFVQQNPIVNAFTYGSEKHIIVVHSALLERLNEARIDIRQGVDASLIEKERDLTRVLNAKAQREMQLKARRGSNDEIATLHKEIGALEDAPLQLEDWFQEGRDVVARLLEGELPGQIDGDDGRHMLW